MAAAEPAGGGMDPALSKAGTHGCVGSLRKLDVEILGSTTPQGNTALHVAALHGHTKFAREVLKLKEELLVAQNADGNNPLHLAAKNGRLKVAELIISFVQARVEDPDTKPRTEAEDPDTKARAEAEDPDTKARAEAEDPDTNARAEAEDPDTAFKIFVISYTVAMCSSIVAVFCCIWAWRNPIKFMVDQLLWGHRLTIIACLAMLVSLMTTVYVTVAPTSRWPAYVVIAIGTSTPTVVVLILGRDVIFVPL